MTTLADKIRAAIDENERVAVAAAPFLDGEMWIFSPLNGRVEIYDKAGGVVATGAAIHHRAHIARHDPASVLRRCAADRKILDLHTEAEDRADNEGAAYLWGAITALAEAYGIEA